MGNNFQIELQHGETDRNAYNAAFYELGFRWHWDRDTYTQLLGRGPDASGQIRYYLETRQPHLLKAYDAAFLVDVIQRKKDEQKNERRAAAGTIPSGYFDWSETLGSEIGA